MKSILKKVAEVAIAAVLALGMFGCSDGNDTHEHTFATTYTSSKTHHWYAATCEHTAEVKDKGEHNFGEYVSNNDAIHSRSVPVSCCEF